MKKFLLDFFNHRPEADDRTAEGAVAGTGNKRGGGRQSAIVPLLQVLPYKHYLIYQKNIFIEDAMCGAAGRMRGALPAGRRGFIRP